MATPAASWSCFSESFVRYEDLELSLDISRMNFPDDFFNTMSSKSEQALADMKALEAGGIANPDEQRMVGHYWLRNGLHPQCGYQQKWRHGGNPEWHARRQSRL